MSLAIQESSTEEQRHQRYQCVSWKLLTDDKGSLPISAVCILIRAAANLLHQLSNRCFADRQGLMKLPESTIAG